MTLTVKLEFSPEMEHKLREGIARKDVDLVRQILAEAFEPTVEKLLQQALDQLSEEEFELMTDRLVEKLAASIDSDAPILSEQSLERASIYADHPEPWSI